MTSPSKGWIGVDFDGTLVAYDHWRGATHIGEPIVPMMDRVQRWLAEGREVRIFTARVSSDGSYRGEMNSTEAKLAIMAWTKEQFKQALQVTNIKDYDMIELWDDRAVQVESNTGRALGFSTRGLS